MRPEDVVPESIGFQRHSDSGQFGKARLIHLVDKYPAKMIPEMARFLVETVSQPGSIVVDPFCGSGTVVREAIDMGRDAVGVDVNPLAALLSRSKIGRYAPAQLEEQLEWFLASFKAEKDSLNLTFPNASYWFTPATLRKLGTIRLVMDSGTHQLEEGYVDFWRAVLASIVRRSSRADTRGPKPFISKRARAQRRGRHFDPFKLFASSARERIRAVTSVEQCSSSHARIILGSAKDLRKHFGSSEVDAVITSPPYLNAQDYYRSCKLELWVLGLVEPEALQRWARDEVIGSDRIHVDFRLMDAPLLSSTATDVRTRLKPTSAKSACVLTRYTLDMANVLAEVAGVLKPGGYCAMVTGDNTLCGVAVPTHLVVSELAASLGLELKYHYVDAIRNRWVPPSRNGHSGVILDDHIQVYRKPWETCGEAGRR